MKKKLVIFSFVFALIICAITPVTAFAASFSNNEIINSIVSSDYKNLGSGVSIGSSSNVYLSWYDQIDDCYYAIVGHVDPDLYYGKLGVRVASSSSSSPVYRFNCVEYGGLCNSIFKFDSDYNCVDSCPVGNSREVTLHTGYMDVIYNSNFAWYSSGSDTVNAVNNFFSTLTTQEPLRNIILSKKQLSGVLNELLHLLPILIPVLIAFLAIRKALNYLFNQLSIA